MVLFALYGMPVLVTAALAGAALLVVRSARIDSDRRRAVRNPVPVTAGLAAIRNRRA